MSRNEDLAVRFADLVDRVDRARDLLIKMDVALAVARSRVSQALHILEYVKDGEATMQSGSETKAENEG